MVEVTFRVVLDEDCMAMVVANEVVVVLSVSEEGLLVKVVDNDVINEVFVVVDVLEEGLGVKVVDNEVVTKVVTTVLVASPHL